MKLSKEKMLSKDLKHRPLPLEDEKGGVFKKISIGICNK